MQLLCFHPFGQLLKNEFHARTELLLAPLRSYSLAESRLPGIINGRDAIIAV
jgi:hypothetical protein